MTGDETMKRTEISALFNDTEQYIDSEQTICGWIRTLRQSKTFGFIELNDGSCFQNLQIVFDDNLPNFNEISKLNIGSSLQVKGNLVETPQASSL